MRDGPKAIRYQVTAEADSELLWSSYFYCGLYQLVKDRQATVGFTARIRLKPKEVFGTTFDVTDRELNRTRRVVIDWRDNPDILCKKKLDECDIYFKRNLVPSITYAVCPARSVSKLRPAGISFPVRSKLERPLWAQALGGLYCGETPLIQRSPVRTMRRLYKAIRGPVNVRSFLPLHRLEGGDLASSRNAVLYQPQAYNPSESSLPDDTNAVTEQRAEIVRRLRQEMGDQFVGGFTPNAYSVSKFPDCLTKEQCGRASYCDLLKSCRVCIYTRGLRDAVAWKLGEYMASGRCIMAERPKTLLPRPLEHGREVLFFDSVEDLVQQCRTLLANSDLQRALSVGARAYYEAEVRPPVRVLKMFQESFALG